MLIYINIINYVLIKKLELDLQPGMTVLTGETGAGKSIIIDTLELILGAKTSGNIIYPGTDRCELSATFDLTNMHHAKQWLLAHEFDSDNDCIIRRIITSDGKSKISINGFMCPQQLVRDLGTLLLSIYSQHEYHELLKHDQQRSLLDNFANHQKLCTTVSHAFNSWTQAKKTLLDLYKLTENSESTIDFLKYQLQELEALAINNESIEALHQEHQQLSTTTELLTACANTLNLISESETGSAIHNLNAATRYLEKFKDNNSKINNAVELLINANIQAQEAAEELNRYTVQIEFDRTRSADIEQKLSAIYSLARKHQVKPEELPQLRSHLEAQLQELEHAADKIRTAEQTLQELDQAYRSIAATLTQSRATAADKLSQLVTEKMNLLGMEGGAFKIHLLPNSDFTNHGLEQIEFLVNTNPGQTLQPLNKVASGGELSRLGLAIQVIIAEKDFTPTLIFDEVDVGIGGKTAEIVGQLLRQLGNTAQVVCITHLPQVAVQGHNHLKVSKTTKNNSIDIAITTLHEQSRIAEIARMLGGINVTNQTLNHAQEMLDSVHELH